MLAEFVIVHAPENINVLRAPLAIVPNVFIVLAPVTFIVLEVAVDRFTSDPEAIVVIGASLNTPLIVSPAFNTFALAAPVNAPTNVVDVTDVNPTIVVVVEPSVNPVEPSVNELFVNALFGIELKLVPVKVGVFVQLGVVPDIRTCEDVPVESVAVVAAAL
jgi:hypothetical protein